MKVNKDLIFRAQQKITGANVHRVGNMIGLYDGAVKCANRKNPDLGKEYWKNHANMWKERLETFIKTGKLK